MSELIKIFTDGGSRGNPGPSASAFVVYKDSEIYHKEFKYLGLATNNVAEYSAVIEALKWLKESKREFELKEINFFLDSELVVRQLNGIYKIKDKVLMDLAAEIKTLLKSFKYIFKFQYVPRTENKLADKLVNECLDGQV